MTYIFAQLTLKWLCQTINCFIIKKFAFISIPSCLRGNDFFIIKIKAYASINFHCISYQRFFWFLTFFVPNLCSFSTCCDGIHPSLIDWILIENDFSGRQRFLFSCCTYFLGCDVIYYMSVGWCERKFLYTWHHVTEVLLTMKWNIYPQSFISGSAWINELFFMTRWDIMSFITMMNKILNFYKNKCMKMYCE